MDLVAKNVNRRGINMEKITVDKTSAVGRSEEPTVTVSDVSNAVAQAGDLPPANMTAKQVEKMKQYAKKYWSSMISRGEAKKMLEEALEEERNKTRLLFIQVRTLTELMVTKGHATLEELDNLSKPFAQQIYGEIPEEEGSEPIVAQE
jgi:hypothetical protein